MVNGIINQAMCINEKSDGMTVALPEDNDIFKKLCFGARFNRNDCQRYLHTKPKEAVGKSSPVEGSSLPLELDYFKEETTQNSTVASKLSDESKEAIKARKPLKVPKKPIFKSEADRNAFCRRKGIRVYGSDVPSPIKKFVDLTRPEWGVPIKVVESILDVGLTRPTPVQMQGLPILLAGRDAFIIAPTGSGKTLVFVVSLLQLLARRITEENPDCLAEGSANSIIKENLDPGRIRALVLAPTRELAAQIRDEFRKLLSNDVFKSTGGLKAVLLNKAVLSSWQINPPKHFPAIIVSTPLRLVQAIETKTVDLSHVRHVILDEGDRLLESGLMEQLDDILFACSYHDGPIQKVLLSATIPTGVEDLARTFMNDDDPLRVIIGASNAANESIDQRLVYVGQEEGKLMAIRQLLVEGIEPPVIVFTETIERATALFRELVQHGITVEIIHGGRTQAERERIIAQFRAGRIWFLITTDLLARGLDFPEVACVINYDFPLTTASYIHRIGRTGRAGKPGKALTLFTKDDVDALKIVANVMRQSGCEVPEWMLQLKRMSNNSLLKNRKRRHHLQEAPKDKV